MSSFKGTASLCPWSSLTFYMGDGLLHAGYFWRISTLCVYIPFESEVFLQHFLDHCNRKWCLVWEKIFSFGKIVLKYRLRNCSRDATWVHSFNRCTPNLPPRFRIGAMEAHLHGAKKLGTSKRLWEVLEKVVFMGIVGQGKMFPFQRKGKSCVCESAARTEGKSILLWLIFFTKSVIHFSVDKHVNL